MNEQITDLTATCQGLRPALGGDAALPRLGGRGYFKPKPSTRGQARRGDKAFVISMRAQRDRRAAPGPRHHGHHGRLMILARMRASHPLVPGSDHASIAVHYVIDKA